MAAAILAKNNDVAFKITHISFGSSKFNPTGNETSLPNERLKVKVASTNKVNETSFKVRATAKSETPFICFSIGFWSDNVLFAVYSSNNLGATGILTINNSVDTIVSYTLGLAALPTNNIQVSIDTNSDKLLRLIAEHEQSDNNPHPQYAKKTDVDRVLATKANKTDLTTGLNGKANSSHTHAMDNITGLQTALNGKANSSHTHTMANITDLPSAMNAKANLASPTFTGAPKAPTPAQTVNDTTIATTAYVKLAIAALVGSAPAALDTLEELSNALAGDANLKKTLLTEIGKKANASHNHTMSQITDFEIKNLSTEDLDTVKKAGMYAQLATANATTARHYPEAVAGALLVIPSAYGWMQIYITHNTYRIYVRNANNSNGWLSWLRMDGRDKLNTVDFNNLKNLLVGIPFPYPLAAVPSGCLAFNGQAFNKTTYPILAQKYPSGVLPDLRGEFIRFWDNGREVDSGRALLSWQKGSYVLQEAGKPVDNIVSFAWNTLAELGLDHGTGSLGDSLRAKSIPANHSWNVTPNPSTSGLHYIGYARPRNIAFQAICLAA